MKYKNEIEIFPKEYEIEKNAVFNLTFLKIRLKLKIEVPFVIPLSFLFGYARMKQPHIDFALFL